MEARRASVLVMVVSAAGLLTACGGASGGVRAGAVGGPPLQRGQRAVTSAGDVEVALPHLHTAPSAAERADDAGQEQRLARAGALDRSQLIEAVIALNPSVQAAREAWRAATARRAQREALDDPMLSYSFAPLSIASGMRYGQQIELSQRFPWPGKLSSLGEEADAEADAAGQRYEAVKLDLALAASLLYDDYYLVERALDINREHRALLEQLRQSAEARYGVGRGSLQDPLQAELERVHLAHDQIVLETERGVVIARLNALLHRLPNAKLPAPPRELAVSLDEPAPSAALQERALRERAELRAGEARVRAGEARMRVAEREYYPDFTLMVSYSSMWDAIEHQFMLGVAAPLPLQRASRAGAADEAAAMTREAEHELLAEALAIRRDVDVARARVVEALHVVRLYEEQILPLSRDRLKASRAGFEANANDFSAVITAEDRLRGDELSYFTAKAQLSQRRAELERATGELPGAAGQVKP